jgi:hypothetical protein
MKRTLERRITSKIKPIFELFFPCFSLNKAADFCSIGFDESVVVIDGRDGRMGVAK